MSVVFYGCRNFAVIDKWGWVMTHANSIWIELNNKVPNDVKPRAWRELQCALANSMLKRLGISNREFFLGSDLSYRFGSYNGYVDLPDNGHWFDLDYLGRATKTKLGELK